MTTKTTVWIAAAEHTPLGPVWMAVTENGLAAVDMCGSRADFCTRLERLGCAATGTESPLARAAAGQMEAYLDGQRKSFDLPIDWERLPDFQRHALQATLAIPYGHTRTYGQIAAQIGRPRAARAVGRAQATNPMPLVVPCHRVLGSDGKLHGYGGRGGLATKEWLLKLEGAR